MIFQELDIDKKIEHLLLLLEGMKGFSKVVDDLNFSLKNGDIQDNEELNEIYELIIESIKESNQEGIEEKMNNFEKNKNLVSYLKEKEQKERDLEINSLSIDF